MLKIGDFSKFTKISIHRLRHYDEIGLLIPIDVDNISGYRYYSEEQIPYANKIQLLINMGFGLSSIKQILENYDDEINFMKYLETHLLTKQDEKRNIDEQIKLLNNALKTLQGQTNPLDYSIIVKDIPSRKVISYRQLIRAYGDEGILWEKIYKHSSNLNIKYTTPAFDVAIIHNNDHDGMIDVEVQISIEKLVDSTDIITCKTVPSTLMAVVAYQGGYDNIEFVNNKLAKWISDNGYCLNGGIMNVYHISPKTATSSEKFLTEVCFPIKYKKNT